MPLQAALIGRDVEATVAPELLSEPGLVSLVGVGGVGKTSLALLVVAKALEALPSRVWFSRPGRIRNADAAVSLVAERLGIRPQAAIAVEI